MTFISATSPVDGQGLGDFLLSGPAEIQEKIAAAREAAVAWAALTVKQRVKLLAPLSALLLSDLESHLATICQTTGKVQTEALLGEIYTVLEFAEYYQKQAVDILKYRGVKTSPFAFPGATAGIERRPYGVVAVISPWNYPFLLSIVPMLTALYAGNAVILKPSELSLPVGQLIVGLFDKLALPAGLVQWLVGAGECGEQLIDAGPDLVFFTGGLTAGRAVMQRAAQHPIPVILELGGKDPMLVFNDAHMDRACQAALYGAFSHAGQACVSIERLYVQQEGYQAFLKQLLAATAQLRVGGGRQGDIGAMTSTAQIAKVEALFEDALVQGAQSSGPLRLHGQYLLPVVLWNVHHGMRIMQEECFGPLLTVMPFADEAEAIYLANDSDLGLNASIWTTDLVKAQRVARQLKVGNWAINDVLKNVGHPELPFGGVKKSGFGRYHGAEGLLNFSYPVSGLTNRSRLPKEPNWFPYNEQRYAEFKGFLDFVYGSGSIYQRIKHNWQALQAFREYSAFDLRQRWQNLKLTLPWQGNNK